MDATHEIDKQHILLRNFLQQKSNFGWILGTVVIALLISIPVLTVLSSIILPSSDVWQHLKATVLTEYIKNSLLLVIGVSVGTLTIGITTAWLCSVCEFPGRKIFSWLLLLPLAFPPYIIAYTYTGLLDFAGPIQSIIREQFGWGFGDYWFPQVRTLSGAITMLSLVLYPYIYLLTRTAFSEQSASFREASHILGIGLGKTFLKAALPLARPAIIAGLTLVVMETLADYGTVHYFGIPTFTTGIFRTWFGLGDRVAATQLASLLLLFVFLVIIIERYSRKSEKYQNLSNAQKKWRYPLSGTKATLAIFICSIPILLGFIIPALQLFFWAIKTAPDIVNNSFYELVFNTIRLALMVATLVVAAATFLAYGKRVSSHYIVPYSVNISAMGYAVPGIIIAVGVLLPFAWFDNALDSWLENNFGISSGLLLTGTLAALVFAHVVRFMAIGLNSVDASLAKIHRNVDDAAQLLGHKTFDRFFSVHLPLIRSGVLTAALLVFVEVIKELPATLVLRPFNFNTLAVRTYELASDERLADSACSALLIVAVGILPILILNRSITKNQ
ncbi:MAG: ABC transporter permease subunit [Gammaproteobacteria bacterium]|nr:MAG: ABC transporter permease subunit [Gammaproteobacteria bacterium]